MKRHAVRALVAAVSIGCFSGHTFGQGARSFKSGPIQITVDGQWIWTANQHHDSVSRLDTTTHAVVEFALPEPGVSHSPRGVSVREDGSELWVACHDSDRVYVLDGTGVVIAQVDLPWGSGPYSVALSRDQSTALVTLHRSAAVAVIDADTHQLTALLEPVFHAPLGIAWTEDGASAWVTHIFSDGEHSRVTRIDISALEPRVKSRPSGAGGLSTSLFHGLTPVAKCHRPAGAGGWNRPEEPAKMSTAVVRDPPYGRTVLAQRMSTVPAVRSAGVKKMTPQSETAGMRNRSSQASSSPLVLLSP